MPCAARLIVRALRVAAAFFSCALGRSGTAYCWGFSPYVGREVSPRDDGRAPPAPVAGDVRFVRIASDDGGTCGLTAAGEVYCWTRGAPARNAVVTVPLRSLALGPGVACGMGRDDYLYCWGESGTGLIADDTNVPRAPALVRVAGQP